MSSCCLSVWVIAAVLIPAPLVADDKAAAPITDISDVWHDIHHRNDDPEKERESDSEAGRRFFVWAPTIGSRPNTGLSGGVNASLAFFEGDPATTRISTMSGGFRVSQKKQVLSGVRFALFTDRDRWFLQGDHRLQFTSQNTFGLGADTMKSGAENVKYTGVKLYDTAYRKVARGLYVGAGLNFTTHANVRPADELQTPFERSAYAAYNLAHDFSDEGQISSGASVALLYDSRDNSINPQRGWLASSAYRSFFQGFAGGDASWRELTLDVRTYRKITSNGRHKLAFWGMSDLVTSGTAPYLDLPGTASDGRSARGYGDGRYRGDHLAYGEVEYRGTLSPNGLLGMVAFVNTTTVDNEVAGQKLFDTWAPATGLGLRLLMNKRSRTNLSIDYAWGKAGATGFYLGLQEAF